MVWEILWQGLQQRWMGISALLILISSLLSGGLLWTKASHLKKRTSDANIYAALLRVYQPQMDSLPKSKVSAYLAKHLMTVFHVPVAKVRLASGILIAGSLGLGGVVASRATSIYIGWHGDLPYNAFTIWLPVALGLFACLLPFLLIHALLQIVRVKASHQLLPYLEEFEKQYLSRGAVKPALDNMVTLSQGKFQDMTVKLVHSIQRGNKEKIVEALELFNHQVATRFAETFTILLREGLGIGLPVKKKETASKQGSPSSVSYAKDIGVGLRSLIERMHAQQRVQAADAPKKRELSQVGFLTFPVLYGANYYAKGLLTDKARHYLYEIPSQLNLMMAAILFGCIACALNIILGRRKLDL